MKARSLCLLVMLALLPVQALAQFDAMPKVDVRLLAPVAAVQPGDTLEVGLLQQIEEGWHTYWLNPGDSGQATSIEWRLPEGVTAGDILWPAPRRLPYFDMINYGYESEVLLTSELTVPDDWPAGEPLPVGATVSWLVCSDICIPESADLSLTIPTMAGSSGPSESAGMFEQARQLLAVEAPWPVHAQLDTNRINLVVEDSFENRPVLDAYLFPTAAGVIDHSRPQPFQLDETGLTVSMDGKKPALERLEGVLVLTERIDGKYVENAYRIDTGVTPAALTQVLAPQGADIGVISALVLALLGGIILNLMPCVFPVLSLKAVGLVSGVHAGRRKLALHGFAYTAGILVTFAGIALAMWGARELGHEVGWGVQLQSPVFVTILAYLLLTLALSLSGVFEIGTSLMGIGEGMTARSSYTGSFAVGLLAVVVATPCVAPFMGVALGYALAQPLAVSLAVFLMLGLGLALPYLLLSLTPSLARLLPRPGPWMLRLKQALAFPLYASAAWLIWVLSFQVGGEALLAVMIGGVVIGFAAWLKGVADASTGSRSRWIASGLAAIAVIAGLGLAFAVERSPKSGSGGSAFADDALAEPYDEQRLADLRGAGEPVLINLTAAWCLTCQVNDRIALSGDAFARALEEGGVTYFKGDWTNADPAVTALLSRYGRNGVPLYLLYPRGPGDAEILPQLLTESMILDALARAS